MKNKRKYRLGEVEETVSEMEFEDRCEEIVGVDESLQLLISGWYVFIPSWSLYLRAGVACVYDEEANPFFFWKATNGTFIDYNEDYSSVVFKVDPDTGGQNVRVVVGIGDGLGQADQKVINLRGINAEW